MNALIRWSIRYRGLVAALSVVWIVAGTILALRAPLDVFPEFVPPQVTIQTESAGLAPEQVEQIVTRPIEAAINGAPGVASMRSESVYGLSVVLVTFEEGVDAVDVRQGISERLSTLTGKLPIGVEQPKLTPLTSSTMDVVKIGLVSDTVDPFTLRDVADWTVKQRLLAVPGIARVGVYGGAIRQVQIQPKLDRLTALGLTVSDVMKAGREALTLRGGGFIETAAQRITLETPPPAPDPQAIAQTLVTMQNNMPIKLGDVATVTIGPATPVGEATIMGRPGVLLTVSGQFGSNTLVATKATEAAMAEMTPVLEARGIEVYPTLHRPATFVERALGNLQGALLLGSALILLVLYAFLRSVRAALISFLAIPMSMLAAVVVLSWMGQSRQHDDARRLRAGARRARRRRHHRHREHHAPPAPGTPRRRHRCLCRHRERVDRDPRLDALRHAGGDLRLPAGAVCGRRAGPLHRPHGADVHPRRPRLDDRGADRDARAVRAAAHRQGGDRGAATPGSPPRRAGLGPREGPQHMGEDRRRACACRRRGSVRRAVPAQRAHPAVPRGALRRADVDGGLRHVRRRRHGRRHPHHEQAPGAAVHRNRSAIRSAAPNPARTPGAPTAASSTSS